MKRILLGVIGAALVVSASQAQIRPLYSTGQGGQTVVQASPPPVAPPAVNRGSVNPNLPTINFCSGPDGGNYAFVVAKIASMGKEVFNTNIIPTKGSPENLAKLASGDCDFAPVQSDAEYVYRKQNPTATLNLERVTAMYPEYIHFICNAGAGITRVTQLTKKNQIAVGSINGGAQVTWASYVLADKDRYSPVSLSPKSGLPAASQVIDGNDTQCMLMVSGLKSLIMEEINGVGKTSGKLLLVPSDDGDMPSVKDSKGRPLYTKVTIPAGTYPGLPSPAVFSNSVDTLAVQALLVANSNFVDNNETLYTGLLRAVHAAMPAILAKVAPPS